VKRVIVGCSACGAEWEDFERHRDRPLCMTCGSREIENLLFGAAGKAGDVGRVPRDRRIAGAARLLGYAAAAAARESGDWERLESDGEDPNELEAQYWLGAERARLHAAMRKEGIVPGDEDEAAAADAFGEGWELYRP